MPSQLLTSTKIVFEALDVLENELVLAGKVNREYDSQFAVAGAKIGATVNVPKPPRYIVGSGPVIDPQAIVESYVPITLTDQLHVPVSITSADYALSLQDFRSRVIVPAMAALANKIDLNGCQQMAQQTWNCVGTPGQLQGGTATSAQAIAAIMAARQRLSEEAAPMDADRYAVISPATNTGLVQAQSSLFNPQSQVGETYKRGSMGTGSVLGFNFFEDQNVISHTASTLAAAKTNTVNAAQGASNVLQADSTASYAMAVNDIGANLPVGTSITFANVYAVNPQNRLATTSLKNFVVASAYTSGETTLRILPYPIFSGPFQNCYAAAGQFSNNATLSLLNGYGGNIYSQNLLFHKNAYTLATADLPKPANTDCGVAQSKAAGLSIRFIKNWYDAVTDQMISRFDILVGWKAIYPELAVKLNG
jgi:hypothetical protein